MTDPAKIHAPQTQAEFLAAMLEMRSRGLMPQTSLRAWG